MSYIANIFLFLALLSTWFSFLLFVCYLDGFVFQREDLVKLVINQLLLQDLLDIYTSLYIYTHNTWSKSLVKYVMLWLILSLPWMVYLASKTSLINNLIIYLTKLKPRSNVNLSLVNKFYFQFLSISKMHNLRMLTPN